MRLQPIAVLIALIVAIAFAGPGGHAPVAAQRSSPAIYEAKVVDLTYPFDASTIYWPTAKAFEWQRESWGRTASGYWYAAARYAASEHGGTHLDSPIHFAEGKATVDEIPVERLMGPAVVIDVSAACGKDADYRLSAEDVAAWEKRHGRIPAGTIVLVRTSWGRFWPDRKKYLGDDTPGEEGHLRFPGISREAAEVLVARDIDGVGIDTASMDSGASKQAFAHRVFGAANIYGLENVANLEQLPATGATVIALPMKIKGGSGAPTRIIALLP